MPNQYPTPLPTVPVPTVGSSFPPFTREGNYFIYCNNPEKLVPSHLGDRNQGNRSLLWSRVSGACQAWYEHTNGCNFPINYGLLAYNPNRTSVTVTVTHSGAMLYPEREGEHYWSRFFRGDGRVITIPPQGTAWLLQETGIPQQKLVEGVARFSVAGGEIIVMNYAYRDVNQLDGTQTYIGYVCSTNGSPPSREYKGIAVRNGAPCGGYVLLCDQTFTLRQQTTVRSWRTNGCNTRPEYPDCVGTDMLAFQCPTTTGSPLTFDCSYHFGYCDAINRPDNLGNWGVQYIYRTRFENMDTRPQRIDLVVSQPSPDKRVASTVFVVDPDGATGWATVPSGSYWDFYTFTLAPGSSRFLQYQVILCGGSVGGILNSVIAQRA